MPAIIAMPHSAITPSATLRSSGGSQSVAAVGIGPTPIMAPCYVREPMAVALVLDFDGTMTDAEAEGRPFRDGYLEDLALLVGLPPEDAGVRAIADEVEAELAAAPASHAFMWMGRAVAPAIFAALVAGTVVGGLVIARFGMQEGRKKGIPFGPWLAFGSLVGLFFGDDLVDWYLDTFS